MAGKDFFSGFEKIDVDGARIHAVTAGSGPPALLLHDPKVREKLAPIGIEPSGTTPEKFAEVIKSDLVKYAKIAKDADIKRE